jgi:peroxiredoxin
MTTPPRKLRPTLLNTLVPTLAIIVVAVTASLLVREKVGTGTGEPATTHSDPAGPPEVGGIFPDFELPDLQGNTRRVTQGDAKILVINLWATWCEACMIEMPSLQKLDDQLGSEGIRVVTISMDEEFKTEVPPVVKRLGLRVPVFTDPDLTVGNELEVDMIPITYVVARGSQRILAIESGERDWAGSAMIEKLRALATNLK